MIPRSYLFVPADRPDRYAKALATGADAVIIDLEDAVAPSNKESAREMLGVWLRDTAQPPSPGGAMLMVRVNTPDSQWFAADRALVAASPRVDGVVLPKADGMSPLDSFRDKPVLALIETAAGIDSLKAITQSRRIARLAFGHIDFQLDVGIEGDNEELYCFRSQIVLASRLANLPAPIDGVTTSFNDPSVIAKDITRARRFGYGAKFCIHPAQVAPVNAGFRPSDAELAWARRVVDAAGQAQGAAIAVDGKMVDRPVLERAKAMLRADGQEA